MVVSRRQRSPDEDAALSETPRTGQRLNIKLLWRARRETQLLLAIALAYIVAQLLLVHMNTALGSDETVYVSQVYPGVAPAAFGPHRTRGVPWLISPVSLFSPSVSVIRIYLLVVLGILLFIAFRAWVPVLRMRAVGAAALFAAQWITLFNGTQILPNLSTALGSIAAAGYLAQHFSSRCDDRTRRRALWKAAGWVAIVAVFRPTDATFLTAGLLVASVALNPRLLLSRGVVLGGGLVVGWLPWAIEAQLRFGGVLTRLHAASALLGVDGKYLTTWRQYLALTLTDKTGATISVFDYLFWLILAAGAAIAIGRAVTRGDRTAAVAACGGAASLVQYVVIDPIVDPRYLLAGIGLLDICLVAVLPSLPALRAVRVTGWVVTAAIFVAFAGYNLNSVRVEATFNYVGGFKSIELAAVLRKLVPAGPCFFASQYAHPEIAFYSGCIGGVIHQSQATIYLSKLPGSHPVYMLTEADPNTYKFKPVPGSVHRLRGPDYIWRWILWVAPPGVTQLAKPTHFVQ